MLSISLGLGKAEAMVKLCVVFGTSIAPFVFCCLEGIEFFDPEKDSPRTLGDFMVGVVFIDVGVDTFRWWLWGWWLGRRNWNRGRRATVMEAMEYR